MPVPEKQGEDGKYSRDELGANTKFLYGKTK